MPVETCSILFIYITVILRREGETVSFVIHPCTVSVRNDNTWFTIGVSVNSSCLIGVAELLICKSTIYDSP